MRKLRTDEVKGLTQNHTDRKGLNPGPRPGLSPYSFAWIFVCSLRSCITSEEAYPQNLGEYHAGRTLAGWLEDRADNHNV